MKFHYRCPQNIEAKWLFWGLFLILPFLSGTIPCRADDSMPPTVATPTAVVPQSQPTTATAPKIHLSGEASRALMIHRPRPSPAWGKVIQYHRQEVLPLSDKNRETLHEFLFQDDDGVVRTATFHESASGDGYWEVYVWDQP